MNINEVFPSKWICAADLKGDDIVLTIDRVTVESVGRDSESKPVVFFIGAKKGFVLNKTTSGVIANLYGMNTDKWLGQGIILYPTQCEAFGEIVDCVRVRPHKPSGAPAAPATAPVEAAPAPAPAAHASIPDSEIPF